MDKKLYDVIIIGGNYAGMAAAMALGRALRNVLVIDSSKPCNRQTPHSHNFLTQDGKTPAEISALAMDQVSRYPTVEFYKGLAVSCKKTESGFEIITESQKKIEGKKLILASGVLDIMPDIKGFAECWGISVIHCPYCHGYEVKQEATGILGNGEYGFEFSKLINNWTKELTLFTNGPSTLTKEQTEKILSHGIKIVETEVHSIEHKNGYLQSIQLKDGSSIKLKAIYSRPAFKQHCTIPAELGCEINEMGYLKVDAFQKTNVAGVYACGDTTVQMRSVANAVATGTFAGAALNKEMIDESF